jgi:hypothetical protein
VTIDTEITDAENGELLLTVAKEDLAESTWHRGYWDILATDAAGTVTKLAAGRARLDRTVTAEEAP